MVDFIALGDGAFVIPFIHKAVTLFAGTSPAARPKAAITVPLNPSGPQETLVERVIWNADVLKES